MRKQPLQIEVAVFLVQRNLTPLPKIEWKERDRYKRIVGEVYLGDNRTLRMQIRRLTRLTDAHSKKWENHEAALALFMAYYGFCRRHMTLKTTPAKASGLAKEPWSLERLLAEVAN